MAKLINREITHINSDIVADIEVLLKFAQNSKSDKEINDAIIRVSDYLADYKLEELQYD